MKTTRWMIGSILMLLCFFAQAQEQKVQQSQQATDTTETQSQNMQEDQQGTSDANQERGTGDTPGAAEAAARENTNEADTTAEVSNAPAVPQTTESSSGSPAVLSGDDGAERDGTNTVQRASMNMAGSPAGNLNLSEGQAVDPDSELADRQDRTQEKQVSAETRSPGVNTASGSEEINNNTRRENNARSDQNLSSKDKNNQPTERDKKKDKQRRKKERG